MSSGYSPRWRRFLQRVVPFLFTVCPMGNYHWRRDRRCYCVLGFNGISEPFIRHGRLWHPSPSPGNTQEQRP